MHVNSPGQAHFSLQRPVLEAMAAIRNWPSSGTRATPWSQASSVTAAYRALEQDDYDESSESAPGLWKRLSGKIRDEYLM